MSRFRRILRSRLALALGLPALTLPAFAVGACGGKTVIDPPISSGAGGATTAVGTTTASGQVGTSTTVSSSSGNSCTGTEGSAVLCLDGAPNPCPEGDPASQALVKQLQLACCVDPDRPSCFLLKELHCGPMAQSPEKCCYAVTTQIEGCAIPGRPLVVDGAVVTATAVCGDDAWCSEWMPDLSILDSAQRAQLAERWTADGLLEHASVASFSRMAIALMTFGAPPSLVDGCHRAARQEIGHARDAFALASVYAGEARGPGRLPLPANLPLPNSFETLAIETLREGCINEAIAAIDAAARLACATDPAVRAVLTRVAEEESEHAELAWRCLRWLLEQGDASVRRALDAELVNLKRHNGNDPETLSQIVVPCLESLLDTVTPAEPTAISQATPA